MLVTGFSLFSTQVNAYPSNAMVKVGIMDNAYKTVERTSVTIYGTEECIIKDNENTEDFIKLPKGKFLTITKKNGIYTLSFISDEDLQEQCYEANKDFTITCPNGVLGIKNLVRGGKPALYRGEFRITSCNNKNYAFYLVNCLDVEYYLKGVVPCEMPVSFGLEALKAQAVAARNYSLSPRTKMTRCYDVVDSVASQVYHGFNRESDISNTAIDKTHGIVALQNDEMIVAVFSSTAGGYTEDYSNTFSDPITRAFPSEAKTYLIAKPDLPKFKPLNNEDDAYEFYSTKPLSYDIHSPLYRWTRNWTKDELEKVLKSTLIVQSKTGFVKPALTNADEFGTLQELKVTKRGESGKIISLEIKTDKTTYTVEKELIIRRIFTKDGKALPSANVVFKYDIDKDGNWSEIKAYGGGFGHGCGMSQYGAMYMARDCKMSFETILKHYYNGICLGTKPFELKDKFISQCFYAINKKAILIIPEKYDTEVLQVKINDEIVNLDIQNSGKKCCEIDISQYIKKEQLNTIIFTPPCQNRLDTRRMDKVKPITIYIKLG
ncbi:MAG: SpoIID/LytB domain-containing protein [Candidatus Gastranaerophilales bacterium]|nr:SpoIID/LytB domain-containing protein [Candidatus Gastranaerophilales bacterium]